MTIFNREHGEPEYLDMPIAKEKIQSKLVDGGETTLTCSNCDKPLLIIWSNRPNEKMSWRIRATCPYCEKKSMTERSFAYDMAGGFAYRGFDKPIPGKPADEVEPILNVKDIHTHGDEVLFLMEFAPVKGK